jgi:hypothetical protein
MGYVNTPAHMTAGLSRSAGDRVWIGNQRLVVRRANVYPTSPVNRPTAPAGTNLGFVESIGPLIQALVGAGTATYGIIEARKDKERAASQAKKAEKIAAAAAEAARVEAAAATQQMQQQQAAPKDNLPVYLSAAAAGVGLLLYFLKR